MMPRLSGTGDLKKNDFLNELNRLQNNVCLGKSITE